MPSAVVHNYVTRAAGDLRRAGGHSLAMTVPHVAPRDAAAGDSVRQARVLLLIATAASTRSCVGRQCAGLTHVSGAPPEAVPLSQSSSNCLRASAAVDAVADAVKLEVG